MDDEFDKFKRRGGWCLIIVTVFLLAIVIETFYILPKLLELTIIIMTPFFIYSTYCLDKMRKNIENRMNIDE